MAKQPGPITIRGITYKNRAEAAEVLGVSPNTIKASIARRRLEFVGLGSTTEVTESRRANLDLVRKRHIAEKAVGTAAKPVTIDGVTYPSRTIAAEILGISPSYAARKGKPR